MQVLAQEHETSRLFLRPLIEADKIPLKAYFDSDLALKYFPWKAGDPEIIKDYFDKQLIRYQEHRGGMLALIRKDKKDLVGACGLLVQDIEGEELLEIGYSLIPKHWGTGYAIEAAIHLRDYAFVNRLSEEVVSIVHRDNLASEKLARRNGMKLIRTTTWKELPVNIFGITKAAWAKLKSD